MKTMIKILLFFLFFTLPFINSHLLDFFGYTQKNIFVNGNYEFSKVMFFNIISSLIIILFFIDLLFKKILKKTENIIIPTNKFFYFFYFLILVSTYFSFSPFISFFGNTAKAHSFLMINNLFGIFIVFLNLSKNFRKKILLTILLSTTFIAIFSIWQYYFPKFNYGDLGNRAIGTFGHPNYLALFLVLNIPILYNKIFIQKKYFFCIILIIIIFSLILTKSAWGILVFVFYNIYFFIKKYKLKISVLKFLIISSIFLLLSSIFIYNIYPEKLSSFISRIFIWETTIKIIFSDFKIFFIGGGTETLPYFFSDFKNINLYIFENFGFSADRPHNLFLNLFYHFGIFSLFILFYFIYFLFKNTKNKNYFFDSIIIFFIFTFFNFSSISIYLILIFFISNLLYINKKNTYNKKNNFLKIFFLTILFIFSITNIYYSSKFYISETKAYYSKYEEASKIFNYNPINFYAIGNYKKGLEIEKIKSKNYFLSQINNNKNLLETCEQLTKKHSSTENYFLCGKYVEKFGKKSDAKIFYTKGLKKLPDLWNKKSKYYDNYFIKNFIDGKRFFSPKYSNLKEILKKVGK